MLDLLTKLIHWHPDWPWGSRPWYWRADTLFKRDASQIFLNACLHATFYNSESIHLFICFCYSIRIILKRKFISPNIMTSMSDSLASGVGYTEDPDYNAMLKAHCLVHGCVDCPHHRRSVTGLKLVRINDDEAGAHALMAKHEVPVTLR